MFTARAAGPASIAAAALLLAGACTVSEQPLPLIDSPGIAAPAVDTMLRPDSAPPPVVRDSGRTVRRRRVDLPPLADSIAARLVFAPTTQSWFAAAARGKRMLVDLGRVDIEVRKDPARLAAYKLAVAARSPIAIGTRLRLRGPWGADDATVSGFDTWNGRIVAVVESAPRVDSLARVVEPLPAVAALADSASPPTDHSCAEGAPSPALLQRVAAVRDSLQEELRKTAVPPSARLVASIKIKSTQAEGCFGGGRIALLVSLVAGNYEWVRERAVLLSESGALTPLRVTDYRFRAHEAIAAFDGDGDGVDDLAARGFAEQAGATVILRLAEGKRLERLAGGFAWETR